LVEHIDNFDIPKSDFYLNSLELCCFPDLRSVWHKLFKYVAKTTVVIIFHWLGYDLSWNKLNNNYEFLDGEFLINV
jgi:hypothetical protein